MFNGTNCDQKSQLSGILTEPLNPRDPVYNKMQKQKIPRYMINYKFLKRHYPKIQICKSI